MSAWDGSGHRPAGLTLDDEEVLALVSSVAVTIDTTHPEQLVPAMVVWRRIQQRAEDILNEQRASRR